VSQQKPENKGPDRRRQHRQNTDSQRNIVHKDADVARHVAFACSVDLNNKLIH